MLLDILYINRSRYHFSASLYLGLGSDTVPIVPNGSKIVCGFHFCSYLFSGAVLVV